MLVWAAEKKDNLRKAMLSIKRADRKRATVAKPVNEPATYLATMALRVKIIP